MAVGLVPPRADVFDASVKVRPTRRASRRHLSKALARRLTTTAYLSDFFRSPPSTFLCPQYVLAVATPAEVLLFAVTFDDLPLLRGGAAASATSMADTFAATGVARTPARGGRGGGDASAAADAPAAGAGLRNGGLGSVHGRLQLHDTGLRVPTGGVMVTKVVGTPEGRVLLAGERSAWGVWRRRRGGW